MTWDDTISTLLLGTERRPGPTEAELLRTVTVETVRRRAGTTARRSDFVLTHADAETAPTCTGKAAQLLDLVLAEHFGAGNRGPLVTMWLEACASAGRIVPAPYVPVLLDLGNGNTSLRPAIRHVIGSRGRWLARLTGTWPWVDSDADDAPIEVVAHRLRSVRNDQPEAGREHFLSAADGLAAADRAALVSALDVGLTTQDEPLLESLLDDRSGKVRAAAVDLLARLPDSAWSTRMVGRVAPLVTKRRRGRFKIDLPDGLDDAAERDGIIIEAPAKVGRLAWWLRQIIAGVPLGWWESTLDANPTDLARRPPVPEVRLGWIDAVLRQRNDRWAAALFDNGPAPELVPLMNADDAAGRLVAAARTRIASLAALADVLAAGPRSWPPDLSRTIVDRLAATDPKTDRGFAQVVALLDRADGSVADRLTALGEDLSDHWQRLIRGAVSRIGFRTTITQEFS